MICRSLQVEHADEPGAVVPQPREVGQDAVLASVAYSYVTRLAAAAAFMRRRPQTAAPMAVTPAEAVGIESAGHLLLRLKVFVRVSCLSASVCGRGNIMHARCCVHVSIQRRPALSVCVTCRLHINVNVNHSGAGGAFQPRRLEAMHHQDPANRALSSRLEAVDWRSTPVRVSGVLEELHRVQDGRYHDRVG